MMDAKNLRCQWIFSLFCQEFPDLETVDLITILSNTEELANKCLINRISDVLPSLTSRRWLNVKFDKLLSSSAKWSQGATFTPELKKSKLGCSRVEKTRKSLQNQDSLPARCHVAEILLLDEGHSLGSRTYIANDNGQSQY